jgi:hypothetical protein
LRATAAPEFVGSPIDPKAMERIVYADIVELLELG